MDKDIKIIRYCPNCAYSGVSVEEGVNGTDYVKCEKCGLKINVGWDFEEEKEK